MEEETHTVEKTPTICKEIKQELDHGVIKHETTVKEEKKDHDLKPDSKRKRDDDCHDDKTTIYKTVKHEEDIKIYTCQMCDQVGHTAEVCSWKYSYCKDWEDGNKDCLGIRMIIVTNEGIKCYSCQFGICAKGDSSKSNFCTPKYWMKKGKRTDCFRCDEEGHWARNCPWFDTLKCMNKEICTSVRKLRRSEQLATIGKVALACDACKGRYEFQWLLMAQYEKKVAKNPDIRNYWDKNTPKACGKTEIDFNSKKEEEKGAILTNLEMICQICAKKGHGALQCEWVYRTCDSIRIVTVARYDQTLFLKCQNHRCPMNYAPLNDAISHASTSNPCPDKCLNCLVPGGHSSGTCPWKDSKCRKKGCNSIRVVKVSDEEATMGKRYLECEKCGDFQWFWHANFERGVCQIQTVIDYWEEYE